MKFLQKSVLAVLAGSLISISAQAAPGYFVQAQANNATYVGVKAGVMRPDADDVDNLVAYGVYAGHQITPAWGVEVEYVDSKKENLGAIAVDDIVDGGTAEINAGMKAKSLGAYGTYRYGFPNTSIYAKGKLGIANTDTILVLDAAGDEVNISTNKTSVGAGVGLGYMVTSNFVIEGEYSMIKADADLGLLTVGANYRF